MLQQGTQFPIELVFLVQVFLLLVSQLVVLVFRTRYLDSTSYDLNEIGWVCITSLDELIVLINHDSQMALQKRVFSSHLVTAHQIYCSGATLGKSTVIKLDVPKLDTAVAQHIHLLL